VRACADSSKQHAEEIDPVRKSKLKQKAKLIAEDFGAKVATVLQTLRLNKLQNTTRK